ncbi:MAG TPA: hypothetical protein VJ837_05445, partial [Candidatus Paceibacterota bacterium]|nr:hypothetical protein [Candidatus Paceibacterota bacterium]
SVFDQVTIGDPSLKPTVMAAELWRVVRDLSIVDNDSRIVPGTKALHHILPELVVPIDRAYTQRFFRWHNPEFQYGQRQCFEHAFISFVRIARATNPQQYLGDGWNSSSTKVIDNAIVGMLLTELPP